MVQETQDFSQLSSNTQSLAGVALIVIALGLFFLAGASKDAWNFDND
jgi:hypothetical protein